MPQIGPPGETSLPIIGGTRQQQLNGYLARYISKLPGTFPSGNNLSQFAGMTYPDIYNQLAQANPNSSPYSIAVYVEGLYIDAALQKTFIGVFQGTGTITGAIGTGAIKGADQFAKDVSPITDPLSFLTSSAFWVRTTEVILGVVLVAVGLSKLAESSPLARSIVNQVPAVKAVRKIVK